MSTRQIFHFCLGVCERPSEDGGKQKNNDGVDGDHTPEGSHPGVEPELDRPTSRPEKSSASIRRALFARTRLDASLSAAPPRSPPPGPLRSSTLPSSPSLSTLRPESPFPGLSPVVQARVPEPSAPPAPLADAASGGRACLHGDGAASTRLVSPFRSA